MAACPAMEVHGEAMLVRRAVDGMVMVAVRTRLRVGLRKGDHAGEHEKGRDKFLLHHHSYGFVVFGNPSPGRSAPIDGSIGRENDLRWERRVRVARRAKARAKTKDSNLDEVLIETFFAGRGDGMQPVLRCHPGRATRIGASRRPGASSGRRVGNEYLKNEVIVRRVGHVYEIPHPPRFARPPSPFGGGMIG